MVPRDNGVDRSNDIYFASFLLLTSVLANEDEEET